MSARHDLAPLSQVIREHGLNARKGLGQHFLLDANLTDRIARQAAPLQSGTVIEVGPGPGGLTRSLLALGAKKLIAIERDVRCIAALEPLRAKYTDCLEIVSADATKMRLGTLGEAPRQVVANLPYNVGTKLLTDWLLEIAEAPGSDDPVCARFTVMLQKEVVDRLAAPVGSRDYGRLSVIAQWLCAVTPLFDVDRRAFVPPPNVDSTVACLRTRDAPLAPARARTLEQVTAAAFGQRRKMLRSSLKSLVGGNKALGSVDDLLDGTGLDGTERAEVVPIETFCRIARTLDGLSG